MKLKNVIWIPVIGIIWTMLLIGSEEQPLRHMGIIGFIGSALYQAICVSILIETI